MIASREVLLQRFICEIDPNDIAVDTLEVIYQHKQIVGVNLMSVACHNRIEIIFDEDGKIGLHIGDEVWRAGDPRSCEHYHDNVTPDVVIELSNKALQRVLKRTSGQ